MSHQVVHEGFPKDGRLRWVRWIDQVDIANPSATPAIHLLLSVLSEETTLEDLPPLSAVAANPGDMKPYRIHVGSLPFIRLGTVFLDGRAVGELPMNRLGLQRFIGPGAIPELLQANSTNPLAKPAWWSHTRNTIPAIKYPLGSYKDSFCLQFNSENLHLIIPCSEIFRVLCAPETLLANALLSGPWTTVCDEIINEVTSETRVDFWEVGLRTGLTGGSATAIAAYHWTTFGRQTASRMLSHEIFNGNKLRHLRAMIPYEFNEVSFNGDGIFLLNTAETKRFLILRITAVDFHGSVQNMPGMIKYRLDNFNTDRNPDDRGEENSTLPLTTVSPIADRLMIRYR
jgi:hypothetical protein